MKLYHIITLVILLLLPLTADTPGVQSTTALEPENQHRRVGQIVTTLLNRNHYKKFDINDSLSSEIFDQYVDMLDHNRRYFLQSDIDEFERFRYFFDDFIKSSNLSVSYAMYNRFHARLEERMQYVEALLTQEFDFTLDEYFEPDRSEKPWAKTSADLDSIWRKQIKHEALNLKITGKEWDKIVDVIDKRYNNLEKRMNQSQSEDVFQLFMNAFASCIDPHTSYFSPKAKDDFNIHMSKSLEGIGASLRTEDDYTKVVEIIPGGPADKDGRLQPNDRIVGVAQGDDSAMVDVIGWRIDDVVQLIRGPKESVVRLQVLKAGATPTAVPKLIRLVRDKVRLEDQTAKRDTIKINQNGRDYTLGVIKIPTFYFDIDGYRKNDPEYKSTTRDVADLLLDMRYEGVDGVIIDLRRNGGGFLSEAISLTGLFIRRGPVVQVRDALGRIKIESDTDPEVVYDGPLAVLVDQFSASASEIFAAAIQDYGRGVVIGNQTFGKGTVQNAIDLNRYFPNSSQNYGQLKMTIAKFYRVTGGSTQHVGVIPDVTFPSRFEHKEIGESSHDNALLWDQIDPARIKKDMDLTDGLVSTLKSRHTVRISEDPEFNHFLEEIEEHKESREKKRISLNETVRTAEREENEEDDAGEENEEKNDKEDEEDFLLTESAYILGDLISLSGTH